MRYLKKWHLILFLILGVTIYSCQKDDFLNFQDESLIENDKSNQLKSSENFKGAKKLKNPYSLKNMQKALENVKKNIKSKKIKVKGKSSQRLEESIIDFEIGTSHYYVKLTPQNADEENVIKSDTTMHVFDYPLDYEFTDEYLDNRTPDADSIPEYYTSVPVDAVLPTISSDILEELYIPEEDPFFDKFETEGGSQTESQLETRQGEINNHEDLLRHLLIEAFTLTDNESELLGDGDTSNAWWIFGKKWNPSGTLKIWDDKAGETTTTTKVFSHWEYYNCDPNDPLPHQPKMADENNRIVPIDENLCKRAIYTYTTNKTQGKYVPLVGAQVLMRQWFTIRQGITDANGYFRTKTVRGSARYIIQWERYHYSIRNGAHWQAETRGPKNKSPWNHSIKGGDDEYHGMIHTAAYDYYYKTPFGLITPPKNSFWKKQLKIAAREQNDQSYHVHQLRLIWLAQIQIKEWGDPSDQVYGTTIHELAHAAHWRKDKEAYNKLIFDGYVLGRNSEKRTLETWATAVEIMFVKKRYIEEFDIHDHKYYRDYRQDQTIAEENHYTSAGYDLIDSINQRNDSRYGRGSLSYPIDRCSGYTLKQIENALAGAKSWNQWKERIKSGSNNPTREYVDELFNNWN